MAKTAPRRATPSSPPKARQATTSPQQTRPTARGKTEDINSKQTIADGRQTRLESVGEQEVLQPQVAPSPELEGGSVVVGNIENASQLGDSNLSHGANVTEGVSTQYDDLDVEMVFDNLTTIDSASQAIFQLFEGKTIKDLVKDVQNKGSTTSNRFLSRAQRLGYELKDYGTDYLLHVDKLCQHLAEAIEADGQGTINSDQIGGLETIMIKANLASFVALLMNLYTKESGKDIIEFLEHLCSTQIFPRPFLQSSEVLVGNNRFQKETLDVGVSLLTQWYLCKLVVALEDQKDKNIEPDEILQATFRDENMNSIDLRSGLAAVNVKDLDKLINSRTEGLRKIYADKDMGEALPRLTTEYPWQTCVEKAVKWAYNRYQQLDGRLTGQGGAKAVRESLVASQINSPAAQSMRPPKSRRTRQDTQDIEGNTDFLKQFNAETAGLPLEPAPESEGEREDENSVVSGSTARKNVTARELADEEDAQELSRAQSQAESIEIGKTSASAQLRAEAASQVPTSAQPQFQTQDQVDVMGGRGADPALTNLVLQQSQRQTREANKENMPAQRRTLLERQQEATRETFDSPEAQASTRRRTKKRAAQANSEDEAGFEAAPTPKRSRQRAPRSAPRNQTDSLTTNLDQIAGQAPSTPARLQIGMDGSTPLEQSDFQSPEASFQAYTQANLTAKRNIANLSAPRLDPITGLPIHRPQVRKRWEEDEVRRFMDLMADLPGQYSAILKADASLDEPRLQARSQVNLKDKAYNMKFDFEKAGMASPPGFEHIRLKAAQQARVDQVRRGVGEE